MIFVFIALCSFFLPHMHIIKLIPKFVLFYKYKHLSLGKNLTLNQFLRLDM